MKRNKNLQILIEGHYNCADSRYKGQIVDTSMLLEYDDLSLERAKTVRDYLVRKGIKASRINTLGKRCSQMLFPHAENEREMEQNRRVEIKVLEY